jgi:hypothetical protein
LSPSGAEAGYSLVPKALPFMRQLGRHDVGQSASTITKAEELAVWDRSESSGHVTEVHVYDQVVLHACTVQAPTSPGPGSTRRSHGVNRRR